MGNNGGKVKKLKNGRKVKKLKNGGTLNTEFLTQLYDLLNIQITKNYTKDIQNNNIKLLFSAHGFNFDEFGVFENIKYQILNFLIKKDLKKRVINLNTLIHIETEQIIPEWFIEQNKYVMAIAAGDGYGSYALYNYNNDEYDDFPHSIENTNVSVLSKRGCTVFICLPEGSGILQNYISILLQDLDVLLVYIDITQNTPEFESFINLFKRRVESIETDDRRFNFSALNLEKLLLLHTLQYQIAIQLTCFPPVYQHFQLQYLKEKGKETEWVEKGQAIGFILKSGHENVLNLSTTKQVTNLLNNETVVVFVKPDGNPFRSFKPFLLQYDQIPFLGNL